MAATDPTAARAWALPAALRRTMQLSCYGDLAPPFRQANLLVLKACLAAPGLWSETAMLERLLYKSQHQHRGAHHLKYLKEVRRTLSQLRGLQLAALVDDLHCLAQQGGLLGSGPAEGAAGAGASKRGGGGGLAGGGGRVSYRLPSREAGSAVMTQLVMGAALIRGLQDCLHHATGQLAAQVARTFFVPLCSTALAMLARIKVLSLQLLLDCVKTYNALADLLPLLPPARSPRVREQGAAATRDLTLPPQLAATLRPPPPGSLNAAPSVPGGSAVAAGGGGGGAGEPDARLEGRGSSAAAAGQPPLPSQQQGPQPRSRSLRLLLAPQQPAQISMPGPSQKQQQQQPQQLQTVVAGVVAGGGTTSTARVALAARASAVPLPHMIRCRWDELAQLPYVEEVPPGPDDPTWQQRANKVAEQYGYMIAVHLDGQDADMMTSSAAAAVQPVAPGNAAPCAGKRRKNAPAGAPTTAGAQATAPAAPAPTEMGVRIERRSFFDLMTSKRLSGAVGATAPASGTQSAAGGVAASTAAAATVVFGAGTKRTHAAQAMAPLQVFEDRGGKRQKVAAGAGESGPGAGGAAAGTARTGAATPAAPVVMSYAMRHSFVLGLGGGRAKAAAAAQQPQLQPQAEPAAAGGACPSDSAMDDSAQPSGVAVTGNSEPGAQVAAPVLGDSNRDNSGPLSGTMEAAAAVAGASKADDNAAAVGAAASGADVDTARATSDGRSAGGGGGSGGADEAVGGGADTGSGADGGTAAANTPAILGSITTPPRIRPASAAAVAPNAAISNTGPATAPPVAGPVVIVPRPTTRSALSGGRAKPAFLAVPAAAQPARAGAATAASAGAGRSAVSPPTQGVGTSSTAAAKSPQGNKDPLLGIILGGGNKGKSRGGGGGAGRGGTAGGSGNRVDGAGSLAASLELLLGGIPAPGDDGATGGRGGSGNVSLGGRGGLGRGGGVQGGGWRGGGRR